MNNIQYWYNSNNGQEIIFCHNSTISYPWHNHSSIFTIGLLLAGTLNLQIGKTNITCLPGYIFIIPPYLPHRLTANQPYTMLTICLPNTKTNIFNANTNKLWFELTEQIKNQPEQALNLDEMAQAVYLSKYHFLRCFKQTVGLTPHQFQLQNRVRKAQRMLNQHAGITEVALATGFCDQSHFIRHFKKHFGLTPTAYQAAYHQLPNSAPA